VVRPNHHAPDYSRCDQRYGWSVDDLTISETITIPAGELAWTFSPTGGPGGQHANRSSTRAEVRFDVSASRAFDDESRSRLLARLAPGGIVTVIVDETRSQWRNRQIARQRLAGRIREVLKPDPPKRRPTKPSFAARRRRVDEKKARSRTKSLRKPPGTED
jgi:ribosome-associated protein